MNITKAYSGKCAYSPINGYYISVEIAFVLISNSIQILQNYVTQKITDEPMSQVSNFVVSPQNARDIPSNEQKP